MERLTKAAVATGGAALLLLGGVGTVAYWTASGTATGTQISSGNLTVTDGTCGAWQYSAADGGGAVDYVVPGDTVETTCTLTVSGEGTNLGITADLAAPATFEETNALATALGPSLAVSSVELDGVTVPTQGLNLNASGASPHTLTVTLTAQFPYGTSTDPGNDTQDLTATLSDVTVSVVQTSTP
ncbi:MAG: alternate-type signal peptide domain-containing protein [Micrococcales bacterium]|nr:alternate-type signal peptide domain-containing protein [Micrococcales bacterium]